MHDIIRNFTKFVIFYSYFSLGSDSIRTLLLREKYRYDFYNYNISEYEYILGKVICTV